MYILVCISNSNIDICKNIGQTKFNPIIAMGLAILQEGKDNALQF